MKRILSLFLVLLLSWTGISSAPADALSPSPESAGAASPSAEPADPASASAEPAAPGSGAARDPAALPGAAARDPSGSRGTSSLQEYVHLVTVLLESEDFRHLMEVEDFQYFLNDVLLDTLEWLWQNRPVAMKILDELDLSEEDRRLVTDIWDSAERIEANLKEYAATPDGAKLMEDLLTLMDSEHLYQSLSDLGDLLSSDDLEKVLLALSGSLEETSEAVPEGDDTPLVELIRAHGMDPDSETFTQVRRLYRLVADSPWAQQSLPRLLSDETLWDLVNRLLTLPEEPMLEPSRQELRALAEKPELIRLLDQITPVIADFIDRNAEQIADSFLNQPQEPATEPVS